MAARLVGACDLDGQKMRLGLSLRSLSQAVLKLAWILFLVFLPVTSFPYFPPALGGGALVRPLSLFPLLIVIVLGTLPRLFTRPLPKTLLALLPFVLVVIAGSFLAVLRGVEGTLGVSLADRLLRAWITLAIGAAIFISVAIIPATLEDLRSTLRWLYAGFAVALAWGSLQAVYIVAFNSRYYRWIDRIQQHISIRHLFTNRISGMTYEPNWFAGQIGFLLLPWLLASALTNYTVFPWRWRRLTVEWVMLAWALLVMPFTFSRAGLIILVVLAFVSLVLLRPGGHPAKKAMARPRLRLGLVRLLEAGVAVSVIVGFVYFAGANNEFFSRIWDYWKEEKSFNLTNYFNYLGFGARFTYGEAALNTFEAYPAFGVGIGNYAFYFDEMLPDRPLAAMPEVLRLVTPEKDRDRLITTKNLYLRLLSETGLVGTAAFLGFLVAILGCALYLWLSASREQKFWGTAGLLGLIAFLLAAASFDSFAIPNMWVVFGLITASAWVFIRQPAVQSGSRADNAHPGEETRPEAGIPAQESKAEGT